MSHGPGGAIFMLTIDKYNTVPHSISWRYALYYAIIIKLKQKSDY